MYVSILRQFKLLYLYFFIFFIKTNCFTNKLNNVNIRIFQYVSLVSRTVSGLPFAVCRKVPNTCRYTDTFKGNTLALRSKTIFLG